MGLNKRCKTKFDPTKPHEHICSKCQNHVHCRDFTCTYARVIDECADCLQGWELVKVEGTMLKQKRIPKVNKVNRYFPEDSE